MKFNGIINKFQLNKTRNSARSKLNPYLLDPMKKTTSFIDIYRTKTWDEIFGDTTEIPLTDKSLKWLNIPRDDFIHYVINNPGVSVDRINADNKEYKKDLTFMIAQMHRLWIMTDTIKKYLPEENGNILDLGAYPYSFDIIIREYLNYRGKISTTTNYDISDELKSDLEKRNIEVSYVNLDPYVDSGSRTIAIDNFTNYADESIDLAICAHVIEHLYHPLLMLKELHRIMKKNGKFLLTTDNAYMLYALINFCSLNDYLHEPVTGTSAMAFHQWRGHNRFFTPNDLRTILEHTGFRVIEDGFYEVLYNSFSDEYFKNPVRSLPCWRANILTAIPSYRNEIVIMAEKI